MSHMKQNKKKRTQSLESGQYGLEIHFTADRTEQPPGNMDMFGERFNIPGLVKFPLVLNSL